MHLDGSRLAATSFALNWAGLYELLAEATAYTTPVALAGTPEATEAMAGSGSEELALGALVMIKGLVNAATLNGLTGTVKRYIVERERYEVALGPNRKLIKRENLHVGPPRAVVVEADDRCAICLDSGPDFLMNCCGKCVHAGCLGMAMQGSNDHACPHCRKGHAFVAAPPECLVHCRDPGNGNGPLQYVCKASGAGDHATATALLKLLLDKGANPNLRGQHGRTPLIYLAMERSPSVRMARLLVDRGAHPLYVDTFGQTAIDAAADSDSPEALELVAFFARWMTEEQTTEDPAELAAERS